MSGVFVQMSVGGGGAGDRTDYDMRLTKTKGDPERVWTQNVPDYVLERERAEGREGYKELRADLSEYMRQLEEDEQARAGRRGGEDQGDDLTEGGKGEGKGKGKRARTFYRLTYSFDRGATDAQIRRMVSEHQRECFPRQPIINSIHRNTEHAHVHSVVAARGTGGRKLHMGWKTYREVDERWAAIYAREFGPELLREFMEKKEERREHRRAAHAALLRGEEPPRRPEREADSRNRLRERLETARRESGTRGGYEQGITG